MTDDSRLLSRRDLLEHLDISDSTERRRRSSDATWPPHILIGRKIYYLHSSVDEWLQYLQQTC